MILVVGATGMLGLEICQGLRARGRAIRVLVRPGSPKETRLRDLGATIVWGDLKDPPSLAQACQGVSVVITTANSILSRQAGDTLERVDRHGSLALIRAATSAHVGHFIYTSISPRLPNNNVFVQYKREVEAALRSSGLTWTILQPAAFMEIQAGPAAGWDLSKGRARISGSGRVPKCYIATADVAAFAIASINHPMAMNRNLHITGPEPLSALSAIAIAERVTGRSFKIQKMPIFVLRMIRAGLQPFNPTVASLIAMSIGAEQGEGTDMAPLLREFGIQPTTFEEYVRNQSRDHRLEASGRSR